MARNKIFRNGDMLIKIGEIYYIYKESSLETVKHPYLILYKFVGETRNGFADYLCCMISSNAKKANWPYTIPLNEKEGGLKKVSYVLSRNVIRINESDIESYVGRLNIERVEEVLGYIDKDDLNKLDKHI